MSFQALARTWRPRRFDQLVGQAHVVRALTHALDSDKLHHALLFSGTRGVGKTTLARIIAKCLNCEKGVSASPCAGDDACGTCREIDEGRYVDLIEVDAASRTGVDDTRELMDNVQYAPTRGRTKVYLIDEVHMLTKHSFNALLKTLEEPPPRVQFLLATTEPEKIPVTILSRCLQFPLKRLPVAQISGRLRHIIDAESLSADDDALLELARGADGSMRDGLSLLDQAVAFGGGRLVVDDVRDMLGTIGEARVAELVDAVIDARAVDALAALEALYAQGIDMRYLLEAMATAWQQIATVQVLGEAVDDESERWLDSAQRVDARSTQLFYDITLAGLRDFVHAPDPLVCVKMSVLRMLAFAPTDLDDAPPQAPGRTPASTEDSTTTGAPSPASDPAPDKPDAGSPVKVSAREAMARAREQLAGKPNKPSAAVGKTTTPVNPPYEASVGAKKNSDLATRPEPAGVKPPEPESPGMAADEAPSVDPRGAAFFDNPPPAADRVDRADNASDDEGPGQTIAAASSDAPILSLSPAAGAIASGGVSPQAEQGNTHQARPANGHEPSHASSPGDDAAAAETTAEVAFDFTQGKDHPEDWHALLPTLDVQGFAAQLASNGVCRRLDNEQIELELARANAFLATDAARETLQSALARVWQCESVPHLQVKVVDAVEDTPAQRVEADAEQRHLDAVASIENDPIVRQLQQRLGARLRPETIKPHRAAGANPPDAIQQRDEQ